MSRLHTKPAQLLLALVICAGYIHAQAPSVTLNHIPTEISNCVRSLGPQYGFGQKASPLYLSGNFSGTGKREYAVLVQHNGRQGIALCRAGAAANRRVLGAGRNFHGMKDLNFDKWKLYPKRKPIEQGVGEGGPPVLHSDGMLLEWEESASAIVYWNGKKFVWYQQGD